MLFPSFFACSCMRLWPAAFLIHFLRFVGTFHTSWWWWTMFYLIWWPTSAGGPDRPAPTYRPLRYHRLCRRRCNTRGSGGLLPSPVAMPLTTIVDWEYINQWRIGSIGPLTRCCAVLFVVLRGHSSIWWHDTSSYSKWIARNEAVMQPFIRQHCSNAGPQRN